MDNLHKINYILAVLRIGLGLIFFWAFLDKVFGLGFATTQSSAWLSGVSPAAGFLTFGTHGPLSDFYQSMAGLVWVDWMFMGALVLLGISLLLGIGLKIAASGGSLLMLMLWSSMLPPEHHPFLDEHIIYLLILILLAFTKAGHLWGLGGLWSQTRLVKKFTWLE